MFPPSIHIGEANRAKSENLAEKWRKNYRYPWFCHFEYGKSRVFLFLAFQFSVCCLHTIFLGMRRQSLLTRVYARLPWDFVLFAFTTFTRRVVESHQSKVKQPCSLMCVEELFCPLATHFWRVLLKYVRKYCATSWYIVGYMGCMWRLWKQKV